MVLGRLRSLDTLDLIRGAEGEAARAYFDVFGFMVRGDRASFLFDGRSRRPPRDRVNAVLSFLYALIRGDCVAGLQGVGLDAQVGFLHALRPGRPALALDLMEELRPYLADRLALSLINRKQLARADFESTPGGGVQLSEDGRRSVIQAYGSARRRKSATASSNGRCRSGSCPTSRPGSSRATSGATCRTTFLSSCANEMELLVVYDVETKTRQGRRRLRKVALACLAFGQRVQQSVFEITVDDAGLELLTARLLQEIDPGKDSLRMYRLREPRHRYMRSFGRRTEYDLHEPLIG